MATRNPTAIPRTFDEADASRPDEAGGSGPAAHRDTRHAPAAGTRPPNIVIWIMDDVGYGHLSPYGGLVDMPTMQALAGRGMTYSSFHVTPLCAPTRACLLTGRNHHTNHMGSLPRFVTPGSRQDGRIPRESGFLSEMLVDRGYATFCLGKWHLTTTDEINVAASRRAWPLGRGFERFYGFLAGQSSQFNPHLVQDNAPVYPPPTDDPDYHFSEDIVTTGIRYVRELRSGDLAKPFFMYLSFGAGHAPHHVPQPWLDRYRDRFAMGWDEYRAIVHRNQQARGLIPEGAPLSARDPDVPLWSSLDADRRRVYERFMEAFAGMCSHMDAQVGRLVDELARLGELDNTIFIVLSDNGASSEGGPIGAFNNLQFHGQLEQVSASLANIDAIGSRDAYNHYPWGWAWAGNTPFRRWKRETYRGGCAVPFILSWPAGLPERHGVRTGYAHAIDVVPTLLALAGLEAPRTLNGVPQIDLEGTSLLPHLADPEQPSGHLVQYDEMMGHRAIHDRGWRAVCAWPRRASPDEPQQPGKDHRLKPLTADDLDRLEESGWELFDLRTDPAESRDLAGAEPARLRRMISRWWYEAGRYGVLPMMGAPLAKPSTAPTRHVFHPDTAPVFIEAAPSVTNTDYAIEAEIDVGTDPAHGMLLAHGGRFGGYGLLLDAGRPTFIYNYFGLSQTVVAASAPLGAGHHVVRVEFLRTGPPAPGRGRGAPGRVSVFVDGRQAATADLVDTAAGMLSFTGMLTCGYHPAEPFRPGDRPPFRFTGAIRQVRMVTTGTTGDLATEFDAFMRQQ